MSDDCGRLLWDAIRPLLSGSQSAMTWDRMSEVGRCIWRERAERLKEQFADDQP